MSDHNPLVSAIGTLLLCVLPVFPAAQARPDFSGTWVADLPGPYAYGEIRIVRQSADAVHVAMIDYGTAWIDGRFQDVVRVIPWTFPWNEWAPRRGGPTSMQPRARARWLESGLLLQKLTNSGSGDVDRLWRAGSDGASMAEQNGSQRLTFRRIGRGAALPVRIGIAVQLGDDDRLVISCPDMDCRVIELHSGRQRGVSPLPRGTATTYAIDAELRIEPAPAP